MLMKLFLVLLLTACVSNASNELILSNVKFDENTGTILKYVANYTNVIIPDNFFGTPVITIGDNAFSWNNLTNVKLPNSIKVIENYVFFRNCLTSVAIPNSVENINVNTFDEHVTITRY